MFHTFIDLLTKQRVIIQADILSSALNKLPSINYQHEITAIEPVVSCSAISANILIVYDDGKIENIKNV